MALTLDTIVNKVFTTVRNGDGYDRTEVDDFLDEILEEMENREKASEGLKKQIEELTAQAQELQNQLADAKSAVSSRPAYEEPVHSTESFELVLSKARSAYDEIIAEAKTKASGIIDNANAEAADIRTDAQRKITDLSDKLAAVRRSSADFYDQMSKLVEKQNESLGDLKRLL